MVYSFARIGAALGMTVEDDGNSDKMIAGRKSGQEHR
jgi:hypothetical protein